MQHTPPIPADAIIERAWALWIERNPRRNPNTLTAVRQVPRLFGEARSQLRDAARVA